MADGTGGGFPRGLWRRTGPALPHRLPHFARTGHITAADTVLRSRGGPGGYRSAALRRDSYDHAEAAGYRRGPARHGGRRPDHHARGARRVPPRPDPAGPDGRFREPVRPGPAPVGRGRVGPIQASTAPAPHRRGRYHLARTAPPPGRPPGRAVGSRRAGGRAPAHRPAAGRRGRAVRRNRRRPPGRRHRRPDQRADRPPRARGAGRPAADRRGPHRRAVARRRPQDGEQERDGGQFGDVRLDPGRRRPRARRHHPRPVSAPAAPPLPRPLEASLRQDPALVIRV